MLQWKAGIKIAGRNINNLRYADDTTLKQKMKIMASGSITSWEIDGEPVETVSDSIFWGSKITAGGDCTHEIKRCLPLGIKVMTKPRRYIKKQRHYFANKGSCSQGYGFSCGHVWM